MFMRTHISVQTNHDSPKTLVLLLLNSQKKDRNNLMYAKMHKRPYKREDYVSSYHDNNDILNLILYS